MASPGGFKASNLPPIADTGMKGFLKWFQREQPALYAKVAPQIQAAAPSVFSDYTQSVTQNIRARAGNLSLARRNAIRGMGRLGDSTDTGWDFDPTLYPDPSIVSTFTTPEVTVPDLTTPNIDTSDAANSGAGTSTNAANIIGSIVGGITGVYTSVTQAQTAQAITNLQLQRAQQGLSPLNIGMNANGIPTITGALAGGSSLLLIGGAVLLFFMLAGKKSAAA